MKAVNHYVAWIEYKGQRSARYQGFAESLDEFRRMCEEKHFNLNETDEIECIKKDARNAVGRPCEGVLTFSKAKKYDYQRIGKTAYRAG